MAERLGQAGEHAHAQATPTRADVAARHVVQLATEPKDVIGIAGRVATEGREHESFASPLEQLCGEVLLERAELRALGRMRQPQLASRSGEPSLSGDDREVVQ